jgi:hypothetical protein
MRSQEDQRTLQVDGPAYASFSVLVIDDRTDLVPARPGEGIGG